ncbi:hypothetical protein [Streptomyces sp. SYSU K217416]
MVWRAALRHEHRVGAERLGGVAVVLAVPVGAAVASHQARNSVGPSGSGTE